MGYGYGSSTSTNYYTTTSTWVSYDGGGVAKGELPNKQQRSGNLKVGDIVLLRAGVYTASVNNPNINSEYECTGEIVAKGNISIRVLWANGRTNNYVRADLELYSSYKKEPESKRPRCKSIW